MPKFVALVAGAIALAGSAAAQAADGNPLDSRFTVDLGAYWMTSDTTLRADSIDGFQLGTDLNVEDTFGFEQESVFRIEGAWRFFERHKLRLMYFDSQRTATKNIDERIIFDGERFDVGLDVRADFDFRIIQLAYQYDFLRTDKFELGGSLGIHHVDFATSLKATAFIPGTSRTEEIHGGVSSKAPLPVVGLRGNWNFVGDFYFQAHAQFFDVKYEEYDGRLMDIQAGVLWQLTPHFGAGIAYNLFDADVDIDNQPDFLGHLDWEYYGGQAYFRANF